MSGPDSDLGLGHQAGKTQDDMVSRPPTPAFQSTLRHSPERQRSLRSGSVFLHRDLNDSAIRGPVAPVFAQADLETARQAGFASGRDAGLAEAAGKRETTETVALVEIARKMDAAREAASAVADEAAEVQARAMVAAMAAVMPDLVRRSALNEAGAMLAYVLPGLSREPAVTIDVHTSLRDGVAALLARLTPDRRVEIDVQGLDHMDPGAVRVRWSAGEARRRPEAIWQRVMDKLEPALSPAKVQLTPSTETENAHGAG